MNTITETLESYWLSPKQAKIYLLCLEYGMMQPAKIASLAHINRTSCYDTLNSMKQKHLLIETTKKWIKYYSASNPELLFESLQKRYNAFESVLPSLIALSENTSIKPKIKILEWLEGIKQAYIDTLSSEEDILAVLWNDIQSNDLITRLDTEYLDKRINKKIFAKVLLSETESNLDYHNQSSQQLRETRFLKGSLDFWCEINIYGPKKILIVLYNQKELSAMIIESQALYETIKTLFLHLR
jgi:sugar-specific transcriptional regulator TrmB